MTPTNFPECNGRFRAPPDLDPSQCLTIDAYKGNVQGGSMDGCPIVVVAWKPSDNELDRLNQGHPIYMSTVGGLSPHFLTTSFEEAIHPA